VKGRKSEAKQQSKKSRAKRIQKIEEEKLKIWLIDRMGWFRIRQKASRDLLYPLKKNGNRVPSKTGFILFFAKYKTK
jgi:hypothetical protein